MNISTTNCVAFFILLSFIGCGNLDKAVAQETARYIGAGEAILGSSMTLQETEQFALDAAKRDALEKFGTHVQSTTNWQTEETDGTTTQDAFERRIEVFAASIVQLVEGTREVVRQPSGETIKISVTAQFDIDVGSFNERLAQYLSTPETERVDELVQEYVELDTQGSQSEDPDTRYTLYQERQDVENALQVVFQRLDGTGILESLANSREQRQQLMERHVRFVRSNAHPSTIFDTNVQVMATEDRDEDVCLTLSTHVEPNTNMDRLVKTATTLANQWYKDEAVWPSYEFIEHMNQEYVLYITALDRNDRIVFTGENSQVTIRYAGVLNDEDVFYENPAEQQNKLLCTPQDLFADVEEIGLVFTRFPVSRRVAAYVGQHHYRGTPVKREQESMVYTVELPRNRIRIEDVLLTPDTFRQDMDPALNYIENTDNEATNDARVGF